MPRSRPRSRLLFPSGSRVSFPFSLRVPGDDRGCFPDPLDIGDDGCVPPPPGRDDRGCYPEAPRAGRRAPRRG
jgi:hypothetical protein